ELYTTLPVGYVRTPDNRCEKDPDRRVQHAIELVFHKFRECGSVRQVILWFRSERVLLPSVSHKNGTRKIHWRLPVYNTVLKFLKNPIYAGAYAYGKTFTKTKVVDGHPVKSKNCSRPREEWEALIQNHHEGYISWEEYERNQRQIQENVTMKGLMTRGPARGGRSLLSGLLRCRRCGRKLHVSYSGTKGNVPRYSCQGAALNHGERRCISFGGLAIDRAVEREILRVLEPGAIDAAIKATEAFGKEEGARYQSISLALEQARYEADRAFRQYDLVDPENRLVASELERRWDEALKEVKRLERELSCVPSGPRALTLEEKNLILSLAKKFRTVWEAPSTDMGLKKRIARILIEEILVDIDEESSFIEMIIRWSGGCHTVLFVTLNWSQNVTLIYHGFGGLWKIPCHNQGSFLYPHVELVTLFHTLNPST
ncbi:MAG: recombinase family protein, partial [Firmicutes bacterium]|nr:recombinase family protein [Bacillota bacterium]